MTMTEISSLNELRESMLRRARWPCARSSIISIGTPATSSAGAPFVVISTADAEGWPDVSPRGDAPGFVSVVDDKHLELPDRPGNNRLDSFQNLIGNPKIALLFVVPGRLETLRVNGTARLLTRARPIGAACHRRQAGAGRCGDYGHQRLLPMR